MTWTNRFRLFAGLLGVLALVAVLPSSSTTARPRPRA